MQGYITSSSGRDKMKKTTIELTEEQYFFLKEKALELQKQRKHYSIVAIIRDLVEADMKSWRKDKKIMKYNPFNHNSVMSTNLFVGRKDYLPFRGYPRNGK
ncbi:MAG: hypothetical protein V1919_01080 [Candidatus Omnitrophota bacterium]